jgi:hypothetical protein
MAKRTKEPQNDAPENAPSDPSKGSRLTIQLDEYGAIAWDRMRPSTRDELLNKLKNDPRAGAIPTSQSHGSAEIFSDPHAAMVFDLLGRLEVMLAMRAYHCSQDQANVLLYTDQEKAILTGPLIKVLNKYGASWFTKYGDEIALAGLLVAVHAPKLTALQDLAKPQPKEPITIVKRKDVETS